MKKYTQDHEWIEVNGDTATVGISEHAACELGDITWVELPETGSSHTQGDVLCSIESVKAASDIYAPISGTVCEVNESLEEAPEQVNEGAESKGWICKLSGIDASQLDGLMDEAAYKAFAGC